MQSGICRCTYIGQKAHAHTVTVECVCWRGCELVQVRSAVVSRVELLPEMLKLLQKWSHDFSSAQNDKIFLITMDCLLGPIQRPIHQTPLVHYCKLVMHEVGVIIVANLNPISSQFLNR